ncbi:class I SAM-dependent methyltransferase [Rhizobium sp. TRM95111]|uniref:class I SAM-dependent methyltransferase n=1 Tax=Rhizobium alarense TaxID=2846851 RepID=UPI001F3D2FBB|nr:class I SAM-dependent methyltransferase [Rhizobium alarense]MCF3639359.1 class I SAM-dependent methyltransferase [Rhizobium alarense]
MALPDPAPIDAAHARRMDRMYRYQRHIYDATRKYYLLGRDGVIARLAPPAGGSVLEVACGTGRNLEKIARRYPGARLFGFDISAEMLATAERKFSGRARLPGLRVLDATTFTASDFGVSGFDRIVVSYALSMIPDWEQAIDRAVDALNPGGSLHVVDFGQQENLPAAFRRSLHLWLSRFHVTPRAGLKSVLEAAASRRGAALDFRKVAGGYAWVATITIARAI